MPAKGIGKNPTKDKKPKEKKVKVSQGRHKGVKVYSKSSMFPKAKKAMTSDKAYPLSFGETFKQSKAKGEKTFRWKGKSFHTKTKAELETGKSEKARFERAAKSKKVPNNQSNWNKFKNSKTLTEFFGKLKK